MRLKFMTAWLAASFACFLNVCAQAQSAPEQVAPAGKLERIAVHGPSLAGNLAGDSADRMVSVYLPPSYAQEPKRRYPVLYLLHGFTDSDDRWFGLRGRHFVNVPAATDRAFANGVPELIVVMPNAFTKYLGSMYTTSAVHGDWEAFIVEDLVAYIDRNYRTLAARASRGLAGHSMGGYGTIRLGMKYPQVFSSLYALSPCCMGASMEPSVEIVERAAKLQTAEEIQAASFPEKAMLASAAAWSPNPLNPPHFFDLPVRDGEVVPQVIAKWAANAPLAMLDQYVPNLKEYEAIALDAGGEDAGIAQTVRDFSAALTGYGIPHFSEIYPGDHINRIEQRLEQKVLPFFAERLEFE